MSLSATLSIVGGACELLGLYTAVREFVRTERAVFPERRGRVARRVIAIARRVFRRPAPATVHTASGTATISVGGSIKAKVTRGPALLAVGIVLSSAANVVS